MPEQKEYPKGHWMGIGIAIGMSIGMFSGLIMGIVMDNIPIGIALGPAMGAGIGCALGAALEAKHKNQIRPLSAKEKKTRKTALIFGVIIGIVSLLYLTHTLLFR